MWFFFSPLKFESLRHPLVNHSSLSISAALTLRVAFAVFVCSYEQEGAALRHRGAAELGVILIHLARPPEHSSLKRQNIGSC